MDDPAINGVDPEALIPKARAGDKEALHQLLFCFWLIQLLEKVSGNTSRNYGVDYEAVREFVFDKVRLDISKLNNPHNLPWCEALAGWCKGISINRARNLRRHLGVEVRYGERVAHDNTINIRGRQRNAALCSPTISQEEEIERQERAALQAKMRETVRQVFRSLEPEDAMIISMWANKMKLREMAAATGKAISTVSNRQKDILKELFIPALKEVAVKEIGKSKTEAVRIMRLFEDEKECRDGLRMLIANSLRGWLAPPKMAHGPGSTA